MGGSDPSAVAEAECFSPFLLVAFSRNIFWALKSFKKLSIFNHDALTKPCGSELGGWFIISTKCDLDLLICLAISIRAMPLWFSDSVSAHIEEPCEVPEGSLSSTIFHKYSALSPSSQGSILLQDKKIIDSLEINLQDHSLVYFDFDLRKKLILLLHLLFLSFLS